MKAARAAVIIPIIMNRIFDTKYVYCPQAITYKIKIPIILFKKSW